MPKELSRSFPKSEAAGWLEITRGKRFSFPCASGPPQLPLQRRILADKPELELAQMHRIAPNLHVCIHCLKTDTHVLFFAFDQIQQMLRRVSWHALHRMWRIKMSLSCLCQFIANVGRWFINGEMRFSSCFKMMRYFQSSHSLWLDTWFMNIFVKKCIWQVLKTFLANCFYYSSILKEE